VEAAVSPEAAEEAEAAAAAKHDACVYIYIIVIY